MTKAETIARRIFYGIYIPEVRERNDGPRGPRVTSHIGGEWLSASATAKPPPASCQNPDLLKPQQRICDARGYGTNRDAVDRPEIHPQRIGLFPDSPNLAREEAGRPCWQVDGLLCKSAQGDRAACKSCPPLKVRLYDGERPGYRERQAETGPIK